MRYDDEVLAKKDKVDTDEIKNHMILSLVTLVLQLLSLLALALSNIVLINICFVL